MRPVKDSGATGQLWKKTAKTTAQATVDTRALHLLQRKVEGLRRRVVGGSSSDGTSNTPNTPNNVLELQTLVSFEFNLLTCRPDGGDDDGSDDVLVALQPELRDSITAQNIAGEQWNYSSYDETDQSRIAILASNTQVTETQFITPRFLAGDKIPVWYCLNTGITTGGNSAFSVTGVTLLKGGAGYTLGDTLNVSGGTPVSAATVATLNVADVSSSGQITNIEIKYAGQYTVKPNPTNRPSEGNGANCSVYLIFDEEVQRLAITGREWAKEYTPPAA